MESKSPCRSKKQSLANNMFVKFKKKPNPLCAAKFSNIFQFSFVNLQKEDIYSFKKAGIPLKG